jgi:isopenicillin N synthase-like dioxygenase
MLCGLLDPPIPTACADDPGKPGISNVCLGLANGSPGTSLIGSHLDDDLLTITFYDEPFLEVLDERDQQWKLVDVCENLPIVNVGNTLQTASNNVLHAPFHRVVQTQRDINLIMYDLNECAV